MTKPQHTTASESGLESRIFFSTSEYAQVPPCATDLFAPLAQQLLQEWDCTFQAAESRLAIKVREFRFAIRLPLTIKQRRELLRANGRNPRLIRDLLGDAQLWDLLRRSCSKQIAELTAFRNSYVSQSFAVLRENDFTGSKEVDEEVRSFGDQVKSFGDQINKLERIYSEGLKALTETSKELIQLVSIIHSSSKDNTD